MPNVNKTQSKRMSMNIDKILKQTKNLENCDVSFKDGNVTMIRNAIEFDVNDDRSYLLSENNSADGNTAALR